MSAAKEKEKQEKKKAKAAHLDKAPLRMPKKKGEEAPPTRLERILLLKDRINKSYHGQGALLSGDEFSNIFILRRPTGIIDLDLGIGGGWPAGGLSQIIGEDNSGKSLLANITMAEVQKTYGDESSIAVFMTEQKYDKAFAKWKCGVHIAYSPLEIQLLQEAYALAGMPPLTADGIEWLKHQVGYFQEGVFATAEQLLEAAVQTVEENVCQIVLIDSFGALLTAAEAENDEGLEGRHYGGASGVITQFMHRLHAALNLPDKYGRPNTTTVLGINQYRENLKAKTQYDNPLQIAGGRALKHGKLVDVLLKKGSKIWEGPEKQKICVGKEITWQVLKGKAGCHDGGSGDYPFYYGENGHAFGPDKVHNLLTVGERYGIIEKSGAWYGYNGQAIGQGKDNAADFIRGNPQLIDPIRQAIFTKANLQIITKENF